MAHTPHPKRRHAPMVVANWKMNPDTISKAKELFLNIKRHVSRKPLKTFVAVGAPTPYLSELNRLAASRSVKLVAQDMFHEKSGAFTGEVSISMLLSVGVEGVIIGHSERRSLGDTDVDVARNLEAALAKKLTAIVCVGERERDTQGNYFTVVESQLTAALKNVSKNQLRQLVIAYEPVWAIGTGNTATPEDVREMRLFIVKVLSDRFGRKPAESIRIIYGGSVNDKNTDSLMSTGEVDGFLVGGASLKADEFVSIIKTVETYA